MWRAIYHGIRGRIRVRTPPLVTDDKGIIVEAFWE